MKAYIEKYAGWMLVLLIAAYAVLFSTASIVRYSYFLFQNFDLAIGNQILWNLLHGSMDCSIRGGNFLGDHFRPVFFLYLPLYALFPEPRNLLFLQSLILALGAVPLFLIGRMRLGAGFGLLFAFLYLFNPLIGFINLFEFHPEVAVAPLLLCAIYYFLKEKLPQFTLCALLSLMCKENISFILIMMGFWALARRRKMPWYATTFLLGTAWFVLSFKIAIPYFKGGAYDYFNLYGYLGNSFGEVFKTFCTKPFFVLKCLFVGPNLKYLFDVFVQFGFLPIFSPLVMLPAIPPFLQILLTHARGVPEIYNHYSAKLIPFLFVGTIFAVERVIRVGRTKILRPLCVIYLIGFAFFGAWYYGPHLYVPAKIRAGFAQASAPIKRKITAQIPKDAAVISTFDFLPSLSGRKELYSFHYLYWGFDQLTGKVFVLPESLRYVALDFNDFNIFWAVYSPRGDENMRKFFGGADWRVVDGADTIFLFEKNAKGGDKLYEVLSEPVVQNPLIMQLNDRIVFQGYDIETRSVKRGGVLKLSGYFRQTNPQASGQRVFVNKNYGIYFRLVDRYGKVQSEKKWPLCYGVYPNMKWQDGEVIKMLQLLSVPRGLPADAYTLQIGTYEAKTDSFKQDRKRDESELILKHPPVTLCEISVE